MSIYDLGTASLAANGEVNGVGTTWKAPLTLIRVGATIVFKTEPVQIYTISEIISDTQINVYNPNGETVPAGTGYAILAHDGITVQGLAQDVAETLRYYQSINIDDGVVAIESGGTGATTATGARANLGLGSASTENIVPVAKGGTGSDNSGGARNNLGLGSVSTENIVPVAKGGTGATTADGARNILRMSQQPGEYGSINNILTIFNNALPSGGLVSFRDDAVDAASTYRYSASLLTRTLDTYATFSVNHVNGNLRVSGGAALGGIATTNYINDIWGTRNTTVDPNGFIKRASPIVKIFEDGTFDANIEANGVTVTRLSEGVYKIDGCLGLNSDASWGGPDGGFEIPLDKNKQARIWIDYKVDADGSITLLTYHRENAESPAFAQNKIKGYTDGQPIDIPKGVFVSVRVNMP